MNKPVAWILGIRLKEGFTECLVTSEKEGNSDIPLYTHPVKELTDEEIESLGHKYLEVEFFDEGEYGTEWNIYGMVEFARAILRKAQEK